MDALLDALTLPLPEARDAPAAPARRNGHRYAALRKPANSCPRSTARLPEWLAGDPAAGILQGIVRQIWTQNQLRLRKALDTLRLLESAGVAPVVAGPVAWSLQTSPPAIRTIPCLTFLVPRGDVRKSAAALESAGWHAYAQPPSEDGFDWCEQISFTQDNLPLMLHWRLIPTAAHDAVDGGSGNVASDCAASPGISRYAGTDHVARIHAARNHLRQSRGRLAAVASGYGVSGSIARNFGRRLGRVSPDGRAVCAAGARTHRTIRAGPHIVATETGKRARQVSRVELQSASSPRTWRGFLH